MMSFPKTMKENSGLDPFAEKGPSGIQESNVYVKGTEKKGSFVDKSFETSVCPFSEARRNLTEIVNKVAYGKQKVIFTRKGKEIAVLISIEDFLFLKRFEKEYFC